jgi:hypothetical protein
MGGQTGRRTLAAKAYRMVPMDQYNRWERYRCLGKNLPFASRGMFIAYFTSTAPNWLILMNIVSQ